MKIEESKLNSKSNRILDMAGYKAEKETGKNDPQNPFNEYKRLLKAKNYSKALENLTNSLNKGFPNAEYEIGRHYYYGNEQLKLSKNHNKALQSFSVAAEQGHAGSQYFLGLMYLKGQGVESDIKQAILLLESAANQGENEALDLLGKIYHQGYYEISPDYKKAESYYQTAVNQGYAPSMLHLSLLLETLHRYEEAYELTIQAAKMGYIDAANYNMSTYK